jgi:hypothetical protein
LDAESSIWSKGNIDFVGRVKRNVNYNDKEIVNLSLRHFLNINNLNAPNSYRYAVGSKTAEYKSIAKYDKSQPFYDNIAMMRSQNWLFTHFSPSMSNAEIDSVDHVLTQMNLNSSPGYPHSRIAPTKVDFLKIRGLDWLHNYVDKSIENEALLWEPLWTCSLKMEMRPSEKILQDKLRTFTASPIEFSVILNCLCLSMNQGFYCAGNQGRVWSCVGVSKYSRGWNRVGQRLCKHPNFFELDVGEYDSSLFVRLFIIVYLFRDHCLNFKFSKLLWSCYQSIVFSLIVLISGTVIRKKTGNPSGSANTVVDNTLILFVLLAYCWNILAPEHLISYAAFMENVEAALYGDDNTFSVSNEVVGWFNALAIRDVLQTLNIKVTAGGDIWYPRTIYQVKFLSNAFIEVRGLFMPVPDCDKLLCSLLYGSRCDDIRWHLMRAYALLMDGYWNLEFRSIIKKYIAYLYQIYPHMFVNGEVYKGVSFAQVQSTYKSDSAIQALYFSYEKSQSKGVVPQEIDSFIERFIVIDGEISGTEEISA